MLEHHLGNSFMEKEEIDKKTVIRTNWKKLIKQASLSFQSFGGGLGCFGLPLAAPLFLVLGVPGCGQTFLRRLSSVCCVETLKRVRTDKTVLP